ncbi:MAG: hydrogenase maturation nickel metallochaperone HypA [Gemmatimonadetes bacterium]|nr:hydrogenase maturation nickel metallochaperone HypA [Gemmatimonadota bacterium]
MHELSIALEISRLAEERLGRGGLQDLVTVGLEVGNDSGVEAHNLQFCLEALLAPPFRARPLMQLVEGDALRITFLEVDDEHSDDRAA